MEGADENPLDDERLKADLYAMSEENPERFMTEILQVLKRFPQFIFTDNAPVENKIAALTRMLKHYEKTEEFEECQFLHSQLAKLNEIK